MYPMDLEGRVVLKQIDYEKESNTETVLFCIEIIIR